MSQIRANSLPGVSFLATLICLFISISIVPAQVVNNDAWRTDGTVMCMARSGNTLYLGGFFNHAGPYTGSFATVDASSGNATTTLPKVNGYVYTTVPDGSGGWYIGGEFTAVGGVTRNNAARINSDGSLNSSWNPNANSAVHCLTLSGSVVYAGGTFTMIGGQSRSRIAALDATTGNASTWNPSASGTSSRVNSIIVSGSTLYAAGFFTSIGGQTRSGIAALSTSTGLATSWNPSAGGVEPTILAMAISGTTLYAGGAFTSIGGQTRNYIAALSTSTGNATSWNPNAGATVYSIALSGSVVYTGGYFTTIGGQSRNYIAALDASTGNASSWNPNAGAPVVSVCVSGTTIYAAGLFITIGGQSREYIAALDATTGNASAWNPKVDANVASVGVNGTTVCIAGFFDSFGCAYRQGLAAIDVTSGQVTSWNPTVSTTSQPVTVPNGKYIFITQNDQSAASNPIEMARPKAQTWDEGNATGAWVFALAISGSTVYVGGGFTSVGGVARANLAAIDASTGAVTSWNPGIGGDLNLLSPQVEAIAISGSTVYVAGLFRTVNGVSHNNLAAISSTTGLPTTWSPSTDAGISALAISGSTIYIGGEFTSAGGQSRSKLAAIDASTGAATSWNPGADLRVYALALSGSTLYAGGSFTTVAGQTRNKLAAINTSSGSVTSWNPNISGGDGFNYVRGLYADCSTVYAVGNFQYVGTTNRSNVAAISPSTGIATAWNPSATWDGGPPSGCELISVTGVGSTIALGGAFTALGSNSVSQFALLTGDGDLSSATYPGAWTMTSIPEYLCEYGKSTIWPTANASVSRFDTNCQCYVATDPLNVGEGYFTRFPSAVTSYFTGTPVLSYAMKVDTGWNIIGSISRTVATSSIVASTGITLLSPYYWYNNGYIAETNIQPGWGVWVKVSRNGTLTMSGTLKASPSTDQFDGLDKFTVQDRDGGKQDMFVRNGSLSLHKADGENDGSVELPPPPPEGLFDVRFQSGNFVQAVRPEQGIQQLPIDIKSAVYPVVLSWNVRPKNGMSYWIVSKSDMKRTPLTGSGSIQIGRAGTIYLETAAASPSLPAEYSLEQNYPNPFNPSTTIRYAIPTAGHVRLSLFNVLGQTVKVLVDEIQDTPGYRTVTLDGSQLASGMYTYRLESGTFSQVKKLLLIK